MINSILIFLFRNILISIHLFGITWLAIQINSYDIEKRQSIVFHFVVFRIIKKLKSYPLLEINYLHNITGSKTFRIKAFFILDNHKKLLSKVKNG